MQWARRRHCCLALSWGCKRSLLRGHVVALLSLASLSATLLFLSQQDWLPLPGHSSLRDNPVAYTVPHGARQNRGGGGGGGVSSAESNQSQSSSLRSLWREMGGFLPPQRSHANMTSHQQGEPLAPAAELSLEDSNSSLQGEMGVGVGGRLAAQPYRYILNEPNKCRNAANAAPGGASGSGGGPFLVLLISAEPGQFDARNAIRQTWGNESVVGGLGFVRLFLLGMAGGGGGVFGVSSSGSADSGSSSSLQIAIEEESRRHHDIIQQEYHDTYYNLTIKTLMGMNWVATHCPGARYVMKTDSDMFVNTEYLITKLLRPDVPPRTDYFTGYLMRGYAPNRNRDSKWYMPPELYSSERYPIFCSGTGYVFSGDMAGKIYSASLGIRRLHLEDVYVGICLAKLRIDPAPPPNEFLFNHWRVSYSSCKYSHLITSHQFTPAEILKYWRHLQDNKKNACANLAKDRGGRYRHRRLHTLS